MVNEFDWKTKLNDLCQSETGFRAFFTGLLESASGDYISYESLLKIKLADSKEAETELKSQQLALKNSNLLYSRNFSILTDALRIVFETIVLEKHFSQIKKIFGLTEIQEARGGLAANVASYFVRTRLGLLGRPEVAAFLGAVVADLSSEAESPELAKLVAAFSEAADFEHHCAHWVPTIKIDNRESLELANLEELQQNKPSESEVNGHQQDFKHKLDSVVKEWTSRWRSDSEISPWKSSSLQADAHLKEADHSLEQNGSITPKTHNFPLLKDIEKRAQGLSSNLVNYFIGGEILRVEFLKALLEYSTKRRQDKKEKRDLIAMALSQLASETTRLLMAEFEADQGNLIRNELDDRKCSLCHQGDHYSICGRLIHMRKHEWIHECCAYWSEGISEWPFKGGLEIYQVIKKAKSCVCPECMRTGASISGHVDPNKKYHLTCALKNRVVFSIGTNERKVYHVDAWIKLCLSTFQKHYKNCNPLFFIFCMSMELITTFKIPKRLFIVKRNVKGVASEAIKSDLVTDLGQSIRELHHRHSLDHSSENRTVRPTISRIGSLIVINLTDALALQDLQRTSQLLTKIRNQFILGLRRDKLPVTEEYTEGKKDIYSLMLQNFLVARQVTEEGLDAGSPGCINFDVYSLETDINKSSNMFTIRVCRVPGPIFEERIRKFSSQEISKLSLSDFEWTLIDPTNHIETLFYKMGLCYGEIRTYLYTSLKHSFEKLTQSQLNFKNYSDYQHIFYQSGEEQHILLDICEKNSIYDRLKLIWQINSDLENSKDFQRDTRYIKEKNLLGSRSKLNPKSRSFNKGFPFQQSNNDQHRFAEKLILQLANQKTSRLQSEIPLSNSVQMKRKTNSLQKNADKTHTVLKKGYQAYKPLNTMVAPSKIHKYGTLG
jgi:hypothetical protein